MGFSTYAQNGELIIRQGHREVINMVKYTPDGQHLISASDDGMLKMWDVNTGIDIKSFVGHNSSVKCFDITKDGSRMISGDANGKILLWDLQGDGNPLKTLEAHSAKVNVVTLTPDGLAMWSGGDDKLLKQWNMASFDLVKTVQGLTGQVRSVGVSPDGKRIVLGGQRANDVELLLIDAENGVILDDALKHIKGAGAAKVFTTAILSTFAVATSIGKGDVDKDMMNFYVFDYSNIEFMKNGKSVLISQNLYLPMTAAKGEEDKTGGSMVIIADLNEDRSMFVDVNNLKQWNIDYPKARAIFNEDQTRIIVNIKNSINIYDMENVQFPTDQRMNPDYEPPKLKEFTGDIEWLTSIALSPDYRSVVSSSEDGKLDLWDINSGRLVRRLEGYVQPALAVEVLPDGKQIVVGSQGKRMSIWDITTGQLVRVFDRSYDVNHIDVSHDGKYLVTTASDTRFFKLWNIKSGNIIGTYMEKKEDIIWVKFDEDPEYILAATESGELKKWSKADKKIKKNLKENYMDYDDRFSGQGKTLKFEGQSFSVTGLGTSVDDIQAGVITDAVFSPNGEKAITTNMMGEIIIYNLDASSKLVSMALVGDQEFITYTPDYYYTSSKGAAIAIAFKSEDNTIIPFEQMELKYNRPDIVAERIGEASEKLIKSYRAAYNKRLSRLGFEINDLESNISLPRLDINFYELPLATSERSFEYTLTAEDDQYLLSRIYVYVNDVPVYGLDGLDISGENSKTLEKTVMLQLSSGLNEIKTSVINEKGYESPLTSFQIKFESEYFKPDLYLLSIGVSVYDDGRYNLAFAAKDAVDISNTFANSKVFGNVYKQILTNENANISNIRNAEAFLAEAGIDDVVMIFIAGHGVLDSKYDYYFATSNMDFQNPSDGGLAYYELEQILGRLPSRNKLLFMDTCYAGELDKDEAVEANAETKQRGSVSFRFVGESVQYKENSFGLTNTLELSKSLFGDLKKGTGATVISAAGGTEFAREGVESDNGLFTSCLIEGIKTRRADLNRDRNYTVSELRNYIFQRVSVLSDGNQVPTSREENVLNDFIIY